MSNTSLVQPALLSKINERQVLRAIRARGPQSRAEVARHSGISAPTASRAVESLLRAGLLEEGDAEGDLRGRPARKLRLASETVQVLGLVIDASQCRLVAAGLDGRLHEKREIPFLSPDTYDVLIDTACDHARSLMARSHVATLGMAISMPGLIDNRQGLGILSPNMPLTNERSPSHDLTERLGIPVILVQESHALCLAERHYGAAKNMNDFAMIDVSTGIGLGVMSGGRLLTGHAGLAGEIGLITVELEGRACGCGNRGCLETVASDAALAWMLSQRLERKLSVTQALALLEAGELTADAELDRIGRYLAIGLAAVINLFNPSTLFVHSRLFSADKTLLQRLITETGKRALPPSFAHCRIVQARGSKRQGAIAAIIDHLTESVVPVVMTDALSGHSAAVRPRSALCA